MAHPTPVPPSYRLFVGIDIAAATASVACLPPGGTPGRPFTIAQTRPGFAAWQQRLLAHGHAPAEVLVALEATGRYWIAVATALAEAGFPVAVVNPARAHAFAQALARRGKTDALDAQMLADLAARLRPVPWTPPPAVSHALQQRLVQRDALLDRQGQVRNQLHALEQHPVVVTSVRARRAALLETLATQMREVEREVAAVLRQDETWAASAAVLVSIPGIGPITAAWLLVATLTFTACEDAEAATA